MFSLSSNSFFKNRSHLGKILINAQIKKLYDIINHTEKDFSVTEQNLHFLTK